MKRLVRTLFLAGVLMAALCATAWAAENTPTEAGIYNVQSTDSSNVGITIAEGKEKVNVTISNATNGSQYLILALDNAAESSVVPTEQNIVYIDQDGATSSTVSFTVYPKQLTSGKTYNIYVSSNDTTNYNTLTQVGSFEYYAPYRLGYVDTDGKISVNDALMILNYLVKKVELTPTQMLAANVDGDGKVSVNDALQILNFLVNKATIG